MTRSAFGRAVAIAIPLLVAAAAAWGIWPRSASSAAPSAAPVTRPASCVALPARFTGVALPGPQSLTLPRFTQESGMRPQVLEYYSKFSYGFIAGPAVTAESAGAVPLLQWIPPHYDLLSQIAAGKFDSYIRQFARSVSSFGCPLMLSFGHEFNGPWWPWGVGHQPATSFVAAWRHIHDVFNANGARNVLWVWNPNIITDPGVAKPAPWWPGAAYVNMVALDGYYWDTSSTFSEVFTSSIASVRQFSDKLMFIAETGVDPGSGMAGRVTDVFDGAARSGLTGIVYFDIPGNRDWRLERNPAALAAFRTASRE
jgi:mannan endo-1,4-beta-mannosidase